MYRRFHQRLNNRLENRAQCASDESANSTVLVASCADSSLWNKPSRPASSSNRPLSAILPLSRRDSRRAHEAIFRSLSDSPRLGGTSKRTRVPNAWAARESRGRAWAAPLHLARLNVGARTLVPLHWLLLRPPRQATVVQPRRSSGQCPVGR